LTKADIVAPTVLLGDKDNQSLGLLSTQLSQSAKIADVMYFQSEVDVTVYPIFLYPIFAWADVVDGRSFLDLNVRFCALDSVRADVVVKIKGCVVSHRFGRMAV